LAFHSGREVDPSPPSSAEVKEWVELYLHSPITSSWRGAQLGGAQGQVYLLPYTLTNISDVRCIYSDKCNVHIFDPKIQICET
jgi:hypothetical protein